MNKIYSILFDIFVAALFILSIWLISMSDAKFIGLVLFGVSMCFLIKGNSLWDIKPDPKKKTKK